MSKLELGRIGICVNVTDNDGYLDEAIELEKLGYSTIWVSGGQLASLAPLAELVRGTTSIPVAPAIIPLDLHGPQAVTALYADLERTHPGRFVVGLGGPQKGGKPLRQMREFLDRLEAADPPVPAGRRILAALGPRKLELARERFAGAVPLLVTPGYTSWARDILGEHRTLVIDQIVVADTDPVRARNTAREPLRFLLGQGVGGYAENVRRMGFDDTDIAELSDRLVDGLTAWGDADAIEARVREHLDAGADQVALNVLSDGEQPGTLAVGRTLAARLLT
jgi:probable F420-dependent oxidoreductase